MTVLENAVLIDTSTEKVWAALASLERLVSRKSDVQGPPDEPVWPIW